MILRGLMRSQKNRMEGWLKGQTYMVEMLAVIIAAMIIIVASISVFTSINNYRSVSDKTVNTAQDAANALILTRGFPVDWDQNASSATVVGIVSRRNVIDPAKLAALNLTNFSTLMGLGRFNVSITITSGGETVYQVGSANSSTTMTLVQRTCVLTNGSPCRLSLQVSGG